MTRLPEFSWVSSPDEAHYALSREDLKAFENFSTNLRCPLEDKLRLMAIVDAVKSWVIFRPKPSKGKKKMVVPVELKQKYLSRRIQDLVRLKEALTRNDFQPALRLGHQVKGNADTFEFPHMASIGVELEHAAKREDKETLMSLVQKMESAISSAQNIFVNR